MATTDADLVAFCARGDLRALGALFDRHAGGVRRFLIRLASGRVAEVDDHLNATFLEAFRSAKRLRGGSSVRVWLLGIAVDISRHWLRAEARRRSLLSMWAHRDVHGAARSDQLVEWRQLASHIGAALSDLSPHMRAAFLLCEVEELSGREAAQVLGIPIGTLGRHLHEARSALRRALEERR